MDHIDKQNHQTFHYLYLWKSHPNLGLYHLSYIPQKNLQHPPPLQSHQNFLPQICLLLHQPRTVVPRSHRIEQNFQLERFLFVVHLWLEVLELLLSLRTLILLHRHYKFQNDAQRYHHYKRLRRIDQQIPLFQYLRNLGAKNAYYFYQCKKFRQKPPTTRDLITFLYQSRTDLILSYLYY